MPSREPPTTRSISYNVSGLPARRAPRAVLQWSERSERSRQPLCYMSSLPRTVVKPRFTAPSEPIRLRNPSGLGILLSAAY